MHVSFFATRAMARLIKRHSKITLDRLPCDDPARVGRVPLNSSPVHVQWQLHVVETNRDYRCEVIVAIEAFSRYVIVIPVNAARTLEDLETLILSRWLEELMLLKTELPGIAVAGRGSVLSSLLAGEVSCRWWTNTDLSINGHLVDTEHWIISDLYHKRRAIPTDQDARNLSWYLNTQTKGLRTPEGVKESFVPAERMRVLGFVSLV